MKESLIPRESCFLIQLKNLAMTLSLTKLDEVIDAIKECVIKNQCVIPDEIQSVNFIEKLISVSEKKVSGRDVDDFLIHLSAFWQWLVQRRPLDFIYIGKRKNFHLSCHILGNAPLYFKNTIFVDEISPETLKNELNCINLPRPVILGDKEGLSHVNVRNLLGYINIETAGSLIGNHAEYIGVIRKHIDMVAILNNNLRKLESNNNYDKVILGSSFGYYGMHDALLTNAVNLSIASGDAAYNKALVEHCIRHHNIKDFVIVIGFFELFHELAKSSNGYFHLASEFFSSNNIAYDYRGRYKCNSFLFNFEREPIVDILNVDIASWVARREITSLRSSSPLIPEKPISTDFIYSSAYTRRETEYFARFYEREGVAEYNKLIFQGIVEQVRQVQGHIYFIIQPFTRLYNALFHEKMRRETKEFLTSVTDGKNAFCIDLSEDNDFSPEDFSDAHHLNFTGAQKLCDKLKWLKL
ncbi:MULTISPECIES: hypothetical protein [Enterobacter cloacae complex]|uniref:DUF1574 domain-containing protein n=1 Tax=Enterobacter cloacae TaxID=550 RepID=A0A7H8UBP3_ENTCL|nr:MULTISPECIES: hypothetical protein [Enterobacter cloacae complex]MDE4080990.1 hypothetical protein [Enterobacter pasteurii]QKZ96979.1 hypothetical protein HWQ14_04395 [Enterobacter cloacae]